MVHVSTADSFMDQRFTKVYTVISGDPSRGSLALDGEESPAKGSKIKASPSVLPNMFTHLELLDYSSASTTTIRL